MVVTLAGSAGCLTVLSNVSLVLCNGMALRWVTTLITPSDASAAATSRSAIRPLAIVLVTSTAYAMSGAEKSAVYLAAPVTFSAASARSCGQPVAMVIAPS